MKNWLLFSVLFLTAATFAQTEIEPFAPGVPGTYIGDFDFLAPGADIPSSSVYDESGDIAGPDNAWTCDDGSVIAGFAGGIGYWAAGTCELGDELYLVSPEMNFGVFTSSPELTFRYIIDDGAHIGFPGYFGDLNLQVCYKTSAGGTWNTLSTYTTVDNAWHNVTVDLSGAASYATYYLGFRIYGVAPGSLITWGFMGLDEIVVTGIDPGACSDSFSSFTASACFDYTVPSGDETYTVSGTFMDTIPNASGCDSIMTIDVTVVTPDVGVTATGITLTADATGVTYQWVSCPAMTAIAGETNQNFTPSTDGDYAVIITDGTCSDTSACQSVSGVGLEKLAEEKFLVYPNPVSSVLTIVPPADQHWVMFELFSMDGKCIIQNVFDVGDKILLDLSSVESGTYIAKLSSETHAESISLVKH